MGDNFIPFANHVGEENLIDGGQLPGDLLAINPVPSNFGEWQVGQSHSDSRRHW
jgi:hypothetical protein